MNSRADYRKLSQPAVSALLSLGASLQRASLERTLVDLIKVRASQLNGCLFCLDMHVKEARIHGERELRLHHLAAWRESPLYSAREKAALEWCELLTRPREDGVSDEAYARAAAHFNEQELADLTFAVTYINAWNRIGIAFRTAPGSLDEAMGLNRAGLH